MFDPKDPAVLSASQVAQLCGVSRRQFDEWLRNGEFPVPPLKLPGWRRWSKVRVEAFLADTAVAS